jgi:hypothetical protein
MLMGLIFKPHISKWHVTILFMFFLKDFVVIKDKNSKTCVYIVLVFFYIFSYVFDLSV